MCYKPQPCLKIFLWHNYLHSRSRTTDNIAIKCVQTQTGCTIAVAKWIEWNKAFNFLQYLLKNFKIKWLRLFWIIWTTIYLTFYCIPGAERRTILRSSVYERKRVVQLQLPSGIRASKGRRPNLHCIKFSGFDHKLCWLTFFLP